MGKYHGARSFQTFTHERSMMVKKQRFEFLMRSRYPPYTPTTYKMLRFALLTSSLKIKRIMYKRELKAALYIVLLYLFFYLKKRFY